MYNVYILCIVYVYILCTCRERMQRRAKMLTKLGPSKYQDGTENQLTQSKLLGYTHTGPTCNYTTADEIVWLQQTKYSYTVYTFHRMKIRFLMGGVFPCMCVDIRNHINKIYCIGKPIVTAMLNSISISIICECLHAWGIWKASRGTCQCENMHTFILHTWLSSTYVYM